MSRASAPTPTSRPRTAIIITIGMITTITTIMSTSTITITAMAIIIAIRRIPTPIIRWGRRGAAPMPWSRAVMAEALPRTSDYQRDPAAIYRESFAIIRREARLHHLPAPIADIAVRLIHACGMVDIAGDLAFAGAVAEAGRDALGRGAAILCDSLMVAAGIQRRRLPADNKVICRLDDPAVPALAQRLGTTRSAAAVELWGDAQAGAVLAIGNAPTALFHL